MLVTQPYFFLNCNVSIDANFAPYSTSIWAMYADFNLDIRYSVYLFGNLGFDHLPQLSTYIATGYRLRIVIISSAKNTLLFAESFSAKNL